MHNIKNIRKNSEAFNKALKDRFLNIDLNNILSLDEKNRKLILEKENLEKEKKEISKSKDIKLFKKSKLISEKINELGKSQFKIKSELDKILSSIPNIPVTGVPIGKDENSNIEVEKKRQYIKI